ncbi:hypothetical protein Tco_0686820 [Tanacetum coccineum]
MYRPPSDPSRQEEFEHIVMNFIFDQEERIRQLEDYMQVIIDEFLEFSSEIARRLKERIKENKNEPRKIEKITKYPDTKVLENSAKHDFLKSLKKKTFPTPANLLCAMSKRARSTRGKPPHLAKKQWKKSFSPTKVLLNHSSTSSTPIPSLDHNGLTFSKSTSPSFASLFANSLLHLSLTPPLVGMNLHKGVTFRLGGVEREMSLLELGWRVSLYFKRESRDVATLSGLRGTETVNSTSLTHLVWPSIGDGRFNVGNTKAKSIRNPRIELSDRCITMTIMGRKKTTNRGMFVTRIARSFGLLTNEMVMEEGEGDDEEGDGERETKELGAPRTSTAT